MEKSIVTYAGDLSLFEAQKPRIEAELPAETIEWKRNYGRSSKNVVLDPQFKKFNLEEVSSSSSIKSLIGQPILHIYWTECSDVDQYKSTTKDEVFSWITALKTCGVPHDWMIVFVEAPDSRKGTNKLLPRTSVVDRLKTDIGSKYADRCFALLDPSRTDSRAVDSWQTFLHKLRLFLLQAYNRTLMRFEENMRSQREKRNDPNWNFCDYFLLQEELAFVYQLLGVLDEALVQYDELDALFTQFILNSHVSESPQWLESFCGNFSDWTGLSLNADENCKLRQNILKRSPALLDVRNYMFAKQSLILLQMNKPGEIARRCLPFLHNVVQELLILEISCPEGSVACWVLLSALEVLYTCQAYDQLSANQFCYFTAELWAYARQKLFQLGELCGLLPKSQPSSQQLHFIVELSSGIRDNISSSNQGKSPVDRLKEALSSKVAFQRYYLELSETAISTYKHIGRIRSARMVGLELAKFYLDLDQIQKATSFLVDALKTFDSEGWNALKIQTLLDSAKCYEPSRDVERLTRTCAQIACSNVLVNEAEKMAFCEKMIAAAQQLETICLMNADEMLRITEVRVSGSDLTRVTPGSELLLELDVESCFPLSFMANSISVSLSFSEPISKMEILSDSKRVHKRAPKPTKHKVAQTSIIQRTPSNRSTASTTSSLMSLETVVDYEGDDVMQHHDEMHHDENRLEMSEHFDYKQDKNLAFVRLVCKNATRVLRRKDSSGSILKDGAVKQSDFRYNFSSSSEVPLHPGQNQFQLKYLAAGPVGQYALNQLSIHCMSNKLDLLTDKWPVASWKKSKFCVKTEQHSFVVDSSCGILWAGFPQEITLKIFTGSHRLSEGSKLTIKCSSGLKIAQGTQDFKQTMALSVPATFSFDTALVTLCVKADLPQSKDGMLTEHKLIIEDPWAPGVDETLLLHFRPPFTIASKMQSALTRKFLQVSFQSNSDESTFTLKNPSIKSFDESVQFRLVHSAQEIMVLKRHSVTNFIWEMASNGSAEEVPNELKMKLQVHYGKDSQFQEDPFLANLEFKDFKTLYVLRCRIDPAKGGELCRASSICSLSITVEQINDSTFTLLMYEVLADQGLWAVCGRAAGVIDMQTAQKQTVIVEVMPLTGGHLALPKIRLSKYIPPSVATSSDASTNEGINSSASVENSSTYIPRLEPFCPGQVYNVTKTARIHVLPAPSSSSNSTGPTANVTGPTVGLEMLHISH